MSQENVEITGRAYDYFIANGDFLAEVFNPDFVWDMSTFRGGVERPTYAGIEGAAVRRRPPLGTNGHKPRLRAIPDSIGRQRGGRGSRMIKP